MPTDSFYNHATAEHAAKTAEVADLSAGHALAKWRNHPAVLWFARAGEIGDQGPLYAIGGVLAITGLLRRDRRGLAAGLSMVAAVAVADATKSAIKNRVKRSRPDRSLNNRDYTFENGGSEDKEEQSFPSGHVACSVAAAGAVSRFYPVASPYLRCATGLVACSRVMRGRHWPLDLLAGLVIGLAADGVVKALTPR